MGDAKAPTLVGTAPQWAVSGSAARDELRTSSGLHVRVDFGGRAPFDACFKPKDCLVQTLARRLDLVTYKGLKPRARLHAERDVGRVA